MPDGRALVLAIAAGLVAPVAAGAQGRADPPRERLYIEHADQVQRLAQGDSISYYLDGNVRARRSDLRLTAQHVVILDWLGIADFSRDVHVWDPEHELFADHVTYTDSSDVAVANGKVQVIDRKSGSQLECQQAVYDRRAGVLTATVKPEMLLVPERTAGPDSSAAGPGGSADSVPEPVHVWAQQIQFFRDADEVLAAGDVLIRRAEDLTAKSDSARFAREAERLFLRGTPRVETHRFYIEARQIDVALPDQRLQALLARGGATASSRSDSIPGPAIQQLGQVSPNSWIAADSLRVVFRDGNARSLDADGSARSLNYSLESRQGDAATWALSYLVAGRIRLVFDAGGQGLDRVEASRDGRGVYRTVALTGTAPDTSAGAAPDSSARDSSGVAPTAAAAASPPAVAAAPGTPAPTPPGTAPPASSGAAAPTPSGPRSPSASEAPAQPEAAGSDSSWTGTGPSPADSSRR